ncbi:hypothetical protein AMEX_G23876 [Astyanax mexicanus]|uniref:Ig-like domain-containing protein n=1 Tax=Astyanax mexicanus TaxID=7994 RepID=A0A8T2KU16_ASTMX|nr:hypothetical protein AMEX_G23876 [Astyanax mexicanus]
MKSSSSASLFLLCALIINNFTDSSACDFTVAVGSPVTIKLGLDQTDELQWKHDSKRVFKGLVSTLPTKLNNMKLTSDGSLVISSVKKEDNGDHEFEVFLSNGRSKTKKTITLCVHEKPPKPTVNVTCTDGTPNIKCEVKDKTGLTFSWYKNGKKIDETSASLRNIERDQDYECAVEQPIPSEKSNKVRPAKCTSLQNREEDDMLWGFERWIMISFIAGGGSLVLVLMIMLVICACLSCKRRKKRLQYKEENKLPRFPESP